MKPLFFAATFSLLIPAAQAQNAPTSVPETVTPLASAGATSNSTPTPAPNGYDLLIAAGELILPGENGSPSAPELLAPDENLRRQRLAVTRNAPALALARQALQLPISRPLATNYNAFPGTANGRFRELARQFRQESDVRAADGDFAGALESRLDCIALGVAVSRGTFISMLTGGAVESIGRDGIGALAAKLDAPALRIAATRLAAIEAGRAPFSEIVRLEGQETLQLTLSTLPDAKTRAEYETAEGSKAAQISEKQARELLALTPDAVRANNTRLFGVAIAAARVSPHLAGMVPFPETPDSGSAMTRELLQNRGLRFSYERQVAENRLLQSAFELRAQKLESGEYPERFTAPRDPFSAENRLVYRRAGDGYLLYSIGPDARDNRGQAIARELRIFDGDTGQISARKVRGFNAGSRGDILAPVF